MAQQGFWDSAEAARPVIEEVKVLKAWVDSFDKLDAKVTELRDLAELLESESDPEMEAEWQREVGCAGARAGKARAARDAARVG